jgi:hypothetical protein
MRLVCYQINTVILRVGCDPQPEEKLYFGTVDDVQKDLKEFEKTLAQALIVHANDLDMVPVLMNRRAVVQHLLDQDWDKLPKYPQVGAGQSQLRFKENPNVAFINQVKVSIRGEKSNDETVKPPIHIALPPGVRL